MHVSRTREIREPGNGGRRWIGKSTNRQMCSSIGRLESLLHTMDSGKMLRASVPCIDAGYRTCRKTAEFSGKGSS